MKNAAQTIQNIHEDQDTSLNYTRLAVVATKSNEPVKGLCMNCSNFSQCTFPMRGRALYCEEYD